MYTMSKSTQLALSALLGLGYLTVISSGCSASQEVKFRKGLTTDETRCLRELFSQRRFHYDAEELNGFIAQTAVAKADLKGNEERAFIFVVHDIGWCGSAGCLMLIGERRPDGRCHALGEARGAIEHVRIPDSQQPWRDEHSDSIIVLGRRDRGYRRLEAPCELRFDGRQYQQVRDECPNAVVHR